MTILDTLQTEYPQVRIPQKDGTARDIAWAGMTEATLAHLVYHWLKQKAGDAYSTFKGTNSEKLAAGNKVVDNLERNDLRADRETDPVMVHMKRLASAAVSKARPAGTKAVDWLKSDEAKAIWDKALASDKIRAAAEARVKEDGELLIEL